MSWAEQNCSQENNSILSVTSAERNTAQSRFRDFSADDLKQSILTSHDLNNPVEELVATGEAVFEFIRNSEMGTDMKSAFHQLEKQFIFYRNLCLMAN